jgi:hypothetical protein
MEIICYVLIKNYSFSLAFVVTGCSHSNLEDEGGPLETVHGRPVARELCV